MTTSIQQPDGLSLRLYPHQLKSIEDMEERERVQLRHYNDGNRELSIKSRVGILADITGYGKTFSIIGLLLRDKMEIRKRIDMSQIDTTEVDRKMNDILKKKASQLSIDEIKILLMNSRKQKYDNEGFERCPTDCSQYIMETENIPEQTHKDFNCNLILVNNSLIDQWEKELSYSTLRVGVVKHIATCKKINPDDYDVILCSPSQINTLVNVYNRNVRWKRFIFDEPTSFRLKINEIHANFYWLISATPEFIRSRLYNRRRQNEFVQKLVYVAEQGFKQLIVKNDDDFVKSSYSFPEPVWKTYECFQPLYKILNGTISTELSSSGIL